MNSFPYRCDECNVMIENEAQEKEHGRDQAHGFLPSGIKGAD